MSRGKTLPESGVPRITVRPEPESRKTTPREDISFGPIPQSTFIRTPVTPFLTDPAAFARDRVPRLSDAERAAPDVEFLKSVYRWDADDAHLYDRQCDGVGSAEAFYRHGQTLLEMLQPGKDEIGLDLGCGAGRVEAQWADRVKYLVGVDFSPTMIAKARAHASRANVTYITRDGETLRGVASTFFDFVWCELVFQHVPKRITLGYIEEVRRVLRPGGRFACQIPRVEVYGDDRVCGGMTEAEVRGAFAGWSRLEFPDGAWRREYYHVALAVK